MALELRAFLGATVVALVGSIALAAPSYADEYADPDWYKNGTLVADANGACGDGNNASNGHVKVCFAANGDYLYVKDVSQDGRSAYGEFDEHVTAFGGGDFKSCRNPHGYGTWARCGYSILSGTRVKFFGYTRDNEGVFNPTHDWTSFVYDWNGG